MTTLQLPQGLLLRERLSPRTALVQTASGELRIFKAVPEWAAEFAEARHSIEHEARILKALGGLGVAPAVLSAESDALQLEWIPGRALEIAAITSSEDLNALAEALLRSLQRLHGEGRVVHADLSPGNIVVGPGGVRLIDFELAHFAESAQDRAFVPGRGAFRGTALYAAPEVARSEAPTAAADVFSFAAIMLACATHAPPRTASGAALLVEAGETQLMFPTQTAVALSEPLRAALSECLSMNPNDRPTARDALEALRGESQP